MILFQCRSLINEKPDGWQPGGTMPGPGADLLQRRSNMPDDMKQLLDCRGMQC